MCPSGTGLGSVHLLKYIVVLDICGQQFGEHVTVEYICWYWIYYANIWGMNVSQRVSVCPSGTGLGSEHLWEYIFVLDICCQQFWEHVTVENICWYWIFHANIWGMNVSKRVSVCPSDTGLESEHFIGYMLPTMLGACDSWSKCCYWIFHANIWGMNES